MTRLEQEDLNRCPYCALLAWQCEHEIVRYFTSEGQLTDCALASEVRQAGSAVNELYQRCYLRADRPTDPALRSAYDSEWPVTEDEGDWSDGTREVVRLLGTLPMVRVVEAGDWNIVWSDDVSAVRKALSDWSGKVGVDAAREPYQESEEECAAHRSHWISLWLRRLAKAGEESVAVETLRGLVAEREESTGMSVRERLGRFKSSARVSELVAMARSNDPDVDKWLIGDDGIDLLIVGDEDLLESGETVLERFLEYLNTYPERNLPHPSDFAGPQDQGEEEWQRIVADFAQLVRDLRTEVLMTYAYPLQDEL